MVLNISCRCNQFMNMLTSMHTSASRKRDWYRLVPKCKYWRKSSAANFNNYDGEFTHSFLWCFKEIWSTVFYWKFFRLCNHQKVQEKRISVSNTWLGPRIDQVWKSLRAEIITEKLLLKQCWTRQKNGPADHSDVDSRELWRELKRRRYKCFAKRCS